MARYFFTFSLIILAVISRLLPHPPNFVPITALALFGGVYLDKKHTFIVPLAAMLISDYLIGFYAGMMWIYASLIAIGFLGLWLRRNHNLSCTFFATLSGSILFYVITNLGVWFSSPGMYPHNFTGLIECYIAAIPFFRNTLLGDVFYVGVMFGVFELARRYVPSLKAQAT